MRFTIKLGGSILEDSLIRSGILGDVASLRADGYEVILVHGGGRSLSRRLAQLGVPSRFIGGLRVTDEVTLAVALMVLAGEVNKRIVAELQCSGSLAVGLCGADAGAVRCEPIKLQSGPDQLGFVGRPVSVNGGLFELLLREGLVPVVSSIALGDRAQLYNVNADQMAAACAWGTGCEALVYLTDVPGVKGSDGAVLGSLTPRQIAELQQAGVLSGGMLPKTQSCLDAIERGVRTVYILPGASRGILRSFLSGTVREGTCIHAQS